MTGSWDDIAGFIRQQGGCAIVTVVELFGSGPREMGARLVVAPDGSFTGTIGGGTLEWQALAAAQAMLSTRKISFEERKYGLGPDLGQCCGGHVTLYYETLLKRDLAFARRAAKAESRGPVWIKTELIDGQVRRQIADESGDGGKPVDYVAGQSLSARFGKALTPVGIFGAGHVGKALVAILKTLPLRIVWLDSRPIEADRSLPANVTFRHPDDPVAEIATLPDGAYVYVMTHSHALDLDICLAALAQGRFAYVGVIGSKTKRARFEKRLRDEGLSAAQMDRFHSPLGLETIRGKEPSVIAVSIAADLVQRIEKTGKIETGTKKGTKMPEQYRASG